MTPSIYNISAPNPTHEINFKKSLKKNKKNPFYLTGVLAHAYRHSHTCSLNSRGKKESLIR